MNRVSIPGHPTLDTVTRPVSFDVGEITNATLSSGHPAIRSATPPARQLATRRSGKYASRQARDRASPKKTHGMIGLKRIEFVKIMFQQRSNLSEVLLRPRSGSGDHLGNR